jgi:ligand-binding sensor domain-containing protein
MKLFTFTSLVLLTAILAPAQPSWLVYTTANSGLTDGYIRALAVDSQNVVWIGTQNDGVFRFDGSIWRNYNSTNSILADDYILCLAIAPDSALWVGMRSGGVARLKDSSWHEFWTGNSPLPSDHIMEISFDLDTVWIATYGGLVRLIDTSWTVFNSSNSGLPYNTLYSVVIDPDHNKWIGTSGKGVTKFDGVTWTTYNESNSDLPNNYIATLRWRDSLWIAMGNSGVATLNGSRWTIYNTSNSGLPDVYVFSLAQDRDAMWIGTAKGAARFDGATWTVLDTANSPLPNKYVRSMAVDRNGNTWFGTLDGLAQYNAAGIMAVGDVPPSGLPAAAALYQNYPNPFNPTTLIRYSLLVTGQTRVTVYDVLGREVAVLVDGLEQAGEHRCSWSPAGIAGGVYYARLTAGGTTSIRKMLYIR